MNKKKMLVLCGETVVYLTKKETPHEKYINPGAQKAGGWGGGGGCLLLLLL